MNKVLGVLGLVMAMTMTTGAKAEDCSKYYSEMSVEMCHKREEQRRRDEEKSEEFWKEFNRKNEADAAQRKLDEATEELRRTREAMERERRERRNAELTRARTGKMCFVDKRTGFIYCL